MTVSWNALKSLIDKKQIYPQYIEDEINIYLFYVDGSLVIPCILNKNLNSDAINEFDSTYKSHSNKSVHFQSRQFRSFFFSYFNDNDGNDSMIVKGSESSPKEFGIYASLLGDIRLTNLKLIAVSGSIQYSKFLGIKELQNGILVKIKSENDVIVFPLIKTTLDLLSLFTTQKNDFVIIPDFGKDSMILYINREILLKKKGFYGEGNDDYIKIFIMDELNKGTLFELKAIGSGRIE